MNPSGVYGKSFIGKLNCMPGRSQKLEIDPGSSGFHVNLLLTVCNVTPIWSWCFCVTRMPVLLCTKSSHAWPAVHSSGQPTVTNLFWRLFTYFFLYFFLFLSKSALKQEAFGVVEWNCLLLDTSLRCRYFVSYVLWTEVS